MVIHGKKTLLIGALGIAVSACEVVEDTSVTFTPAAGTYQEEQVLSIDLPPTATNVYLTTDTRDPIISNACSYGGEDLLLDRATTVKLRFDVQGKTYTHERTYLIEANPQNSNLTNRTIIETWENFFVKNVYNQIPSDFDNDFVKVINDEDGGSVTVTTRILDRSFFFDIPIEGEQIFDFNFFEKTDADTGEVVVINSGAVYGYRNEDGGYYSTKRKAGKVIKFDGTYRGWAEGGFTLNADGETTGGSYKVFCTSPGCSDVPVVYALGSTRQFIEISPTHHENTRACQ
ncbi:MAG: hypothetical protein MI808_05655 [Pseudomonadales bacterium]|nr:hypothetical protein [Pseudomonadales bacterium]